ncbi:MAG: L-threonylcarbamoyladenylate synthase [Methylococcales bacterium]|nr:L-threonylcarbamoyladenylate synthase [Methylococcales bacterium]
MAQLFEIHPDNPQPRLIQRSLEIINAGGLMIYPSDTGYALACQMDDKQALDRLRRIRLLDEKHDFTLICEHLTQVSHFTKIDNDAFRVIKSLTPGPFTFILDATREVPRRLQHPKKKTIGIHIPDHPIIQALLAETGQPLFSSSLQLPDLDMELTDPYLIREHLEHGVDLIIDAGILPSEQTTIIDCTGGQLRIMRQGKGQAPMLS